MISRPAGSRIWLVAGITDMRNGFNGLASKVQNVYCSNGWVEIDNNISENALRGVAVGRKNWLCVSRRSTYGNNVKIAA